LGGCAPLIEGFQAIEKKRSRSRLDDGADATGFFNAEFFASLRPQIGLSTGFDQDTVTKSFCDQLQAQFPGVALNFPTP
jgi:heavy metal efflux system protein